MGASEALTYETPGKKKKIWSSIFFEKQNKDTR